MEKELCPLCGMGKHKAKNCPQKEFFLIYNNSLTKKMFNIRLHKKDLEEIHSILKEIVEVLENAISALKKNKDK